MVVRLLMESSFAALASTTPKQIKRSPVPCSSHMTRQGEGGFRVLSRLFPSSKAVIPGRAQRGEGDPGRNAFPVFDDLSSPASCGRSNFLVFERKMDGPDKPGHDNLVFEFEKCHDLGPLPSAREERASPGMTSGN